MSVAKSQPPWLLLVFSLPARRASQRVEVWRKLRRYGALPLRSAGYVLPNAPANRERFEWLAATIRKHGGEASVVQVQTFDARPPAELAERFLAARARDYEALTRDLQKLVAAAGRRPVGVRLTRLRQRFQRIVEIDFFHSPLRSRAESLLERAAAAGGPSPPTSAARSPRRSFRNRQWITRPRPGIDRAASAWLIRRFVDPRARFAFGNDPARVRGAVPFDMFHGSGFGHRGDDCTFETLLKEFGIRDRKAVLLGQIVHDADLGDEKFGRVEGLGLDRTLIGWAQMGLPDPELLRRGMELIEGLYRSLS